MRVCFFLLCLGVTSCLAMPTQLSHASVLDLLDEFENFVRDDGKVIIEKMVNVIHHVESGVLHVKELVPKVYEKIHEEADQVLAGLKKVTDEVEELIGKQKAFYGFDLLGSLTELSGGTNLKTALTILSLADKAHKVMNDAKEFEPRLEETLNKIQAKIENHVHDFAKHILTELGLQDLAAKSSIKDIENLFERVENEAHILILDLLHKMEQTFELLVSELPEEYQRVKGAVDEVRHEVHDLVAHIEQTLVMRSFSILDLAGNITPGGTDLSTAFKVLSLLQKFNRVVQDVKEFEPKAEVVLQHAVRRVAESAQDFLNHAAQKLME